MFEWIEMRWRSKGVFHLSLPIWLGVVVASAVAGPPRAAVTANEMGLAHLTASRNDSAIASFRAARTQLRADERDPKTASAESRADVRTVDRNLAVALAAKAIREIDGRRAEKAIVLLREARELHSSRIRYRVLLARAHLLTGRDPDRLSARDELVAALEADPDHLGALLLLAGIDYDERRLEEGTARLEHAKTLRPRDGEVFARLKEMRRERDAERGYEALEGAVFIVRYASTIPRSRAETVLAQCERAWSDLTGRLGHYPDGRIVVTLYPPADFLAATNLHGWVAGVSDGSIRLTVRKSAADETLNRTLRHELAHHILRDFAPSTPVWLHEGLAQIAEGRSGARAAARFRRGPLPKSGDLDRSILAERDRKRVARFYDLSLAFTHYLQQLQGDRGIQALLTGLKERRSVDNALEIAFGQPRAKLFDAWLQATRSR